ncbi:MAG TPA: glycosyltransferase [Anaerohalosphaeraceae bacterium]|nr:glycosyltransferase [Anaerohalosphaeraceae bacterium]HOL87664.1 glycosyltransferase [Anaerohalosphaeraceae bacterium]HPP55828.1 glycosyltransferase [Anaerohalosphaeraceae bacterium]
MTFRRSQHGPLVSILISTYNRPQYLAEALESIFRQTWPHLQVVLVRDGGADVEEVVRRFDDRRLTFINRAENRGLPYSFNEALAHARGEYICYLGDDDKFYPHHVQRLVEAIESQDRCGAVYSDLYKVHCRVKPDGRRIALAKNLEISRDFDRMLMLQFNHVLHVSVMHRKDLLERAGGYNENLNVLIDWDLNRKLCFYTDFLHVPQITGEYYGPVGECDRISVQRRKNVQDYLRNVLTIRTTRPPKPWPCVEDLSVLVLAERADALLEQTLRDLWSHTFYPQQIYVALSPEQASGWRPAVPNVVVVPAEPASSLEKRVDRMLAVCEGAYTALVPTGLAAEMDEAAWLERSLCPLLECRQPYQAFELVEATETCWGAVFRTEELRRVRRQYGHLPLRASLQAGGFSVRKPKFEEYPFRFDHFLAAAEQVQQEGDWGYAAQIYAYLAEHFGNGLWMRTRQAHALIQAGRCGEALQVLEPVLSVRPTVSGLMLAARIYQKQKNYRRAIEFYEQARRVVEGTEVQRRWIPPIRRKAVKPAADEPEMSTEESRVWT